MLAFLAAAKSWVQLVLAAIGLAEKVTDEIHDARQREAGRTEERADALERQAESVRQANEAANEAARRHVTISGDEAFDQDFRRRD